MAREVDKKTSATPAVTVQDNVECNAQTNVLTENERSARPRDRVKMPGSDSGQYEVTSNSAGRLCIVNVAHKLNTDVFT